MEGKQVSRNKRISPRGVVTLSRGVREALGLKPGQDGTVQVRAGDGEVELRLVQEGGPDTRDVSARGQLQLPAEAHRALNGRKPGRYAAVPDGGSGVRLRAG